MIQKEINSPNSQLFSKRHIGLNDSEIHEMLKEVGYKSLEEFIKNVVPEDIFSNSGLSIGSEKTEQEALIELKKIAKKNESYKSYIGQGYFNTITPSVILRNVFENPGWYTSYTPYQPEISQGRLEALINFQTMVCDLSSMEIANASLLDEATAAAEAMTLSKRIAKSKSNIFFIDEQCLPQTINVLKTRAKPLSIDIKIGDPNKSSSDDYFGIILQYPAGNGGLNDYTSIVSQAKEKKALTIFATDLLALTLIKPPGEFGADIAIGSSQRFGVPMGFGGPHAAFMATKEDYRRSLPGRIVGASIDNHGNIAYRLALQTREQHIRREKATSNICTAQALLAIMAGFYAIYHGAAGLKNIAERINLYTRLLANNIKKSGFDLESDSFFDTVVVKTGKKTQDIFNQALTNKINLRRINEDNLGISLDETTTHDDMQNIASLFSKALEKQEGNAIKSSIPRNLIRKSKYLNHNVFNKYHTETEMMRYIRKLCDKDIALDRAMIPLGSCTMKLNATSEMLPVSWPEFSSIHPLAPSSQIKGYQQLISELEIMLQDITGYSAISLQPNAGSQGEYSGLLAIDAYHKNRGDEARNICLIPKSAHGTNPASAQMVGMKVIPIECDSKGNIDIRDLTEKTKLYSKNLSALMITYPSTHGVFETTVKEVCSLVHEYGGLVYIDGANFNAMVGLCCPGEFGGDVSHLNLHKTFCIPHGGGGPGIGPIGVVKKLVDFLPSNHNMINSPVGPVSATDWGSASLLPISWMYIKMMGSDGLKRSSQIAILNANYIASRLQHFYEILYKGDTGLVAHECIIDVRPLKESANIEVEDIAKRLIDYGFHAPTMSWPVTGTLMIEPTESESKKEIDRFCDAMISIRQEIMKIESGEFDEENNMLKNSPHTAHYVTRDNWDQPYSRQIAAYPMKDLIENKYWPPVGRVDNVYGDKNLMCSCPSMEGFE
ncbi:MAG: aminomethyl-transferring glycine dehydrogenase [SAR86 cluster bacterium]|jgi:glycine dehydrogenase|nr:aminomethyl-transferring glycine dehydrogenase [SAR86 cluster bacterium]